MIANFKKYSLVFKQPSGTSRGILTQKDTYFITVQNGNKIGTGECALFKGLSYDDTPLYEEKLSWLINNINSAPSYLFSQLAHFPSIAFGLEQALLSLNSTNSNILFPSKFTHGLEGIPINGLVWMGSPEFMKQQISDKIDSGFNCIKMKIGAIDFNSELSILKSIRKNFSPSQIEIRVDANGAFSPNNALEKLKLLSDLQIHSIEQPIKQHQHEQMAHLCSLSPIPIALDEELIGVISKSEKEKLLNDINPQYIILKPSLIGGYASSQEWIQLCQNQNVGWWVTSALESNVGLNAIAQWAYTLNSKMPQGLGTGSLFTNNTPTTLSVKNGYLWNNPK